MKVDYNIILESYQRANEEFLNDCMEIATEAETLNTTTPAAQNNAAPNSTENQVNGKITQSIDTTRNNQLEPSSKKKQSLIQRIQQIIQKVIAKVQEASIKIMNRLKLMLESDKGFFNTLHQRRAAQKPLQNFKAITYTYDEKYLDTTINGIQKLALGSINQLNNFTGSTSDPKIKQILESDQNAVSNVLLSFFTKEKVEGDGPYYAVKGSPWLYSTIGGLDVDEDLQVLDTNGNKINGLYAVGTDCEGVLFTEKKEYVTYGGADQGWAFTSGYILGPKLAEEISAE